MENLPQEFYYTIGFLVVSNISTIVSALSIANKKSIDAAVMQVQVEAILKTIDELKEDINALKEHRYINKV